MAELKRKRSKGSRRLPGSRKHQRNGYDVAVPHRASMAAAERSGSRMCGLQVVYLLFGLGLACYLGLVYARHAKVLHENELWFSHITQLEREISFRTEAGFYYSYYKQLVEAPSLFKGLGGLLRDNMTESLRTINIIHRFNVFQEVVLGTLYRILPIQGVIEPVFFYIDIVFGLHGGYVAVLFCSAWLLSGSLLGGVLAFLFYLFNKVDTTRLELAIPLRESFALPFVAAQILFTSLYLRPSNTTTTWTKLQPLFVWLLFLSSLCVALTWQFAQFVFLLEGVALYSTHLLGLAPLGKVWRLILCHSGALLVVFVLQFFNTMLLGSLAISFTIAVSVVFLVQGDAQPLQSPPGRILRMFVSVVSVIVLTVCVSALLKKLLHISEDDHIFKFVKAKFGLAPAEELHDFDSLLYLCQGAFQPLTLDTFQRLSSTFLLPCYLVAMAALLTLIGCHVWRRHIFNETTEDHEHELEDSLMDLTTPTCTKPVFLISPEFAYNTLQSILFGVVALSTLRFKYLWAPHMCVLAAACASHSHTWRVVLERFHVKDKMGKFVHLIGVGSLIAILLLKELPGLLSELKVLREFYDPDTVELMKWISSNTPEHAVFAGSMQLLAAVKLCTSRTITNHPHFENTELRERTMQVYQMYAHQGPEHVHSLLSSLNTDYIIVEDSICFAGTSPKVKNCRLIDIMDIVNGHTMDHDGNGSEGPQLWPRFCNAVRFDSTEYAKYFSGVFQNNTFRVYRLVI